MHEHVRRLRAEYILNYADQRMYRQSACRRPHLTSSSLTSEVSQCQHTSMWSVASCAAGCALCYLSTEGAAGISCGYQEQSNVKRSFRFMSAVCYQTSWYEERIKNTPRRQCRAKPPPTQSSWEGGARQYLHGYSAAGVGYNGKAREDNLSATSSKGLEMLICAR
jgi:hypothetical protein